MREPFDIRAEGTDRLDLHNNDVDQALARENLCGIKDLRTGRSCHRSALHLGPCAFNSLIQPPLPDAQHQAGT